MNLFIENHLRWCRNRKRRPSTLAFRRRVLEQADRQLPFGLVDANEDEIRDWLDNDRWEPRTCATYWTQLRGAYRWGAHGRNAILDFDPMEEIERPSTPRCYARPVPTDLADELQRTLPEPWNTFVLLARSQGLRCCEIAGLHRDHITPTITTLVTPKGGGVQTTPTHPAVWERVEHLTGMIAEAVGGQADATWISVSAASYFRWKRKLAGVSMHRFRHSYACELRAAGHDIRLVQVAMRHASITSTQIYTEVGNAELHSAVTSLRIPTPATR